MGLAEAAFAFAEAKVLHEDGAAGGDGAGAGGRVGMGALLEFGEGDDEAVGAVVGLDGAEAGCLVGQVGEGRGEGHEGQSCKGGLHGVWARSKRCQSWIFFGWRMATRAAHLGSCTEDGTTRVFKTLGG